MPTINVEPGFDQKLQEIADILAKSRKVVVITGAGISTNCGIPVSDRRSILALLTFIRIFVLKMDCTRSYKHSMKL
jgi:accessory colonization factor AcfC